MDQNEFLKENELPEEDGRPQGKRMKGELQEKSAELLEKVRNSELSEKSAEIIEKIMRKSRMLKRYRIQFFLRLAIFIAILVFYLVDKETLYQLAITPFWRMLSPLHILWAYFMLIMISHLIPREELSMAVLKAYDRNYEEVPGYSELDLLRYEKDMNIKAWRVLLVWLFFNAVFAALYLFGVIDEADMLMLTTFYFLSDYICILFFCPFQSFIIKNRCCVNCRIYDWGHFMMFTPMLFIKNFFSWSLFFTSCVVLIRWEIRYAKHPERFWHGSNSRLKCENCQEQLCHYKRGKQLKAAGLYKSVKELDAADKE